MANHYSIGSFRHEIHKVSAFGTYPVCNTGVANGYFEPEIFDLKINLVKHILSNRSSHVSPQVIAPSIDVCRNRVSDVRAMLSKAGRCSCDNRSIGAKSGYDLLLTSLPAACITLFTNSLASAETGRQTTNLEDFRPETLV